jgi:hypothetical protein
MTHGKSLGATRGGHGIVRVLAAGNGGRLWPAFPGWESVAGTSSFPPGSNRGTLLKARKRSGKIFASVLHDAELTKSVAASEAYHIANRVYIRLNNSLFK